MYNFRKNPTLISIVLGILLLIVQAINGNLSQDLQIVFFATLIVFTGIPHGAIDHLIQKQTDADQKTSYNIYSFLGKYLLIMAVYGLLWYFFSGLSFIFFILISAWHFGETDIEGAPSKIKMWYFVRIIYGLYVLAFILLIHHEEANPVVTQMINDNEDMLAYWLFVQINVKSILYLLGLFLVTFFIVAQSNNFIHFDKFRFLRLISILFITIWLPLIPAFALYFGGWHSLCAFDNTFQYLRKNQPMLTFKYVYLNAMPFTIIAMVFLSGFYWFCKKYTSHIDPVAILFIFISLITLPHLLITNKMNVFK